MDDLISLLDELPSTAEVQAQANYQAAATNAQSILVSMVSPHSHSKLEHCLLRARTKASTLLVLNTPV